MLTFIAHHPKAKRYPALKINENEHEMLGDEKEEKQDKSPDKNSPERC